MIKRFVSKHIQAEIKQPEIVILLGPRQVGKTTLLKELEIHTRQLGLKTVFFDLEQPEVLASFNTSEESIITRLTHAGQVILIDEFQYLQNASKIFKAIIDSGKKTKIFCSGSSSLEIHKHLRESLAGRRILIPIHPLQFSEIKNATPGYKLSNYLTHGGMPGLTHTNSDERKQQLLSELLGSYILKDVKSLLREENIRAFNHLIYLLAEHQGSTVSVHSLANQVKMSSKAVNRYLDILEETYVNFRVYSFSQNLGNELRKSCKTYLYDLGIRNAILRDFSSLEGRQDKGAILESFVFLKLRSLLAPNREIKFWRTKDGDEVDFVLLQNRRPIPIEVKSRWLTPELPKGLKRFLDRYPKTSQAVVVNETLSAMLQYQECCIQFIPFEKFESEWLPTSGS